MKATIQAYVGRVRYGPVEKRVKRETVSFAICARKKHCSGRSGYCYPCWMDTAGTFGRRACCCAVLTERRSGAAPAVRLRCAAYRRPSDCRSWCAIPSYAVLPAPGLMPLPVPATLPRLRSIRSSASAYHPPFLPLPRFMPEQRLVRTWWRFWFCSWTCCFTRFVTAFTAYAVRRLRSLVVTAVPRFGASAAAFLQVVCLHWVLHSSCRACVPPDAVRLRDLPHTSPLPAYAYAHWLLPHTTTAVPLPARRGFARRRA